MDFERSDYCLNYKNRIILISTIIKTIIKLNKKFHLNVTFLQQNTRVIE